MKKLLFISALTVQVVVVSSGKIHAQDQSRVPLAATAHKWTVPLPPGDLLKLLPDCPDRWKMKQSNAKNFVMNWASSQAQREFTYTPLLSQDPNVEPAPTQVLRIVITDTGYYSGLMGDFKDFQVSKNAEIENLMLNGFPARRIMIGKSLERLRLLISNRYILQIDVQNAPINCSQNWLKIVDLAKLATLPVDGPENLPRPFPIVRIDELNSRNNSVSNAMWATQDEADAAAESRR